MIAFRFPRFDRSISLAAPSIVTNPFFFLVFVYFLFSSTDYFNIPFLLFKGKITNLIAFSFAFLLFLLSKFLYVPRRFLAVTLALLGSMCLSAMNSLNPVVCMGFIFFFLFNFTCYFLLTYNLFRLFNPSTLLKIYSYSFYCAGFYAVCQVVFSLGGIILPGVSQYICGIARGQVFTYEPSFYALYMTPFTMYCTAKFILQKSTDRKFSDIFWPNLFLLASTSTGCFFSYLFFLFFMFVFRFLKIIRFPVGKLIASFCITCASTFALIWIVSKKLIVSGLLKFFYAGGAHFSVQDRWRGLVEYWNIFVEHPIVGVGLGVGPFYIAKAKMSHVDLFDPQILHSLAPMNVTTEVLAGMGILGASAFIVFFYLLIDLFRKGLKVATAEERVTLSALAISVCVMFSTLQFNQSIMRCYMWIHIGFFLRVCVRYAQPKTERSRSVFG